MQGSNNNNGGGGNGNKPLSLRAVLAGRQLGQSSSNQEQMGEPLRQRTSEEMGSWHQENVRRAHRHLKAN